MTEADWVGATDPAPLLRFAADRLTDRRRLLVMAGCCRRVWDLLTDPRFRNVVVVAEAVAHGRAAEDDLTVAAEEVPPPGRTFHRFGRSRTAGVVDFHQLPDWCQHTYHAIASVPPRHVLNVADAC